MLPKPLDNSLKIDSQDSTSAVWMVKTILCFRSRTFGHLMRIFGRGPPPQHREKRLSPRRASKLSLLSHSPRQTQVRLKRLLVSAALPPKGGTATSDTPR